MVEDAGFSAKDLNRPALQLILNRVEAGEVQNLIVWKQDRLTRDSGDLSWIINLLRKTGVELHSVMDPVDLSSAGGRMQVGISGVLNQWYRENLSENVQLGMQQAVLNGQHPSRPKFGYSLREGILIPNEDALTVRQIFALRAAGGSVRSIEEATGVCYSTVSSILKHRVYLGEIASRGNWYPGLHEPLVTEAEWEAAQRSHIPGRRRSGHVLSRVVKCGLCGRVATIKYPEGNRAPLFVCKHRGQGCKQPARTSTGIERAVLLGIRLLASSTDLVELIRRELARALVPERAQGRAGHLREQALSELERKRRKLLDLFYEERMASDFFVQEQGRIARQLAELRNQQNQEEVKRVEAKKAADDFEGVLPLLSELDVDAIWAEAADHEKKVLVERLVRGIWFYPDHLEVEVSGAPRMNVDLKEVGLIPPVVDCSCRRGDLNPHTLAGTSPSSWRVYQFRHSDVSKALSENRA